MIYVEWYDACGASGWINPEDMNGPMKVISIGHVAKETKDYICLSPGLTEDGQYMGFITIPKGWIKKRRKLKL